MSYIGKTPTVGNFQVCDAISVVNNQAAYTMQVGSVNVSPESANHMIVSLNGVIQKPTDAFTVSGSTITFASNLVTGDVINFIQILGNVLDLGVPSDSTVSLAKLTATGTKNSTTFLRGDNTFNAPPNTGITMAQQWRLNSNFTCNNNNQTVDGWEAADQTGSVAIGSAMTYSSGVFTFPSTGIYEITQTIVFGSSDYNDTNVNVVMQLSTDTGSNYITQSLLWIGYESGAGGNPPSRQTSNQSIIMDVTNTSTNRFRIQGSNGDGTNAFFEGNSGYNSTMLLFKRIGDT